ncbi:MAG: ABC transporter ATP-binding protein [Chloroflexi bacterium]|nr:ABC transporter ATP-binding protein [Chloroflexota bacterium]MCI0889864.1 ABC transporter ATP-binding protein [Chloroflexota bacterium]
MDEEQLDLKAGTRLLVTELRRQWVSLSLALFAALLWTIARLAIPVVIGATIDNAIDLPGGVDLDLLLWFAIGMLGLAALQGGGAAMRRYFAMRTSHRVEADIRMRFYGSISRLSFDFYDRTATGQLMSRASTDVHEVQMLTVMIPINFAFLMMAIGAFAVLAFIHLWLALLGLLVYPMVTLITVRFFNKLFPATARVQQGLGELTSVVEENIAGGRLVRSFGREELEIAKAQKVADQIYDDNMEVARLRTIYGPLFFLLPTIGQLAILAYGGWLALEGQISAGDFVAFFQLLTMLIWPVQGLGEMIASGQRALTSAARIWNILKEQPTVRQRPHAKSMPDGTGEIEFDHVRFSYIPGQPVLRDFSLKVPAGTSVAIVGATASGKSTVAQLLPRFYDIEEGSIKIDGVDIRDLKLQELRSNVGLVFEDTFLFSDTIRNNIAYGNLDATEEEVMKAAQLAHAAEFIERIPEGYDTVVGEQGYSLSGGQRQRIAIARAMLKQTRVLILDDATSSVDARMEEEIRNALRIVMEGRTTVIISHRVSTIALADKVVLIDQGRVVDTGSHVELLSSSPRYQEVLGQVEVRA